MSSESVLLAMSQYNSDVNKLLVLIQSIMLGNKSPITFTVSPPGSTPVNVSIPSIPSLVDALEDAMNQFSSLNTEFEDVREEVRTTYDNVLSNWYAALPDPGSPLFEVTLSGSYAFLNAPIGRLLRRIVTRGQNAILPCAFISAEACHAVSLCASADGEIVPELSGTQAKMDALTGTTGWAAQIIHNHLVLTRVTGYPLHILELISFDLTNAESALNPITVQLQGDCSCGRAGRAILHEGVNANEFMYISDSITNIIETEDGETFSQNIIPTEISNFNSPRVLIDGNIIVYVNGTSLMGYYLDKVGMSAVALPSSTNYPGNALYNLGFVTVARYDYLFFDPSDRTLRFTCYHSASGESRVLVLNMIGAGLTAAFTFNRMEVITGSLNDMCTWDMTGNVGEEYPMIPAVWVDDDTVRIFEYGQEYGEGKVSWKDISLDPITRHVVGVVNGPRPCITRGLPMSRYLQARDDRFGTMYYGDGPNEQCNPFIAHGVSYTRQMAETLAYLLHVELDDGQLLSISTSLAACGIKFHVGFSEVTQEILGLCVQDEGNGQVLILTLDSAIRTYGSTWVSFEAVIPSIRLDIGPDISGEYQHATSLQTCGSHVRLPRVWRSYA